MQPAGWVLAAGVAVLGPKPPRGAAAGGPLPGAVVLPAALVRQREI